MRKRTLYRSLLLCGCLGTTLGAAPAVKPLAATASMFGTGDVADDVCVWHHPTHGARSLIIGVNKSDARHGGLYLFHLDGSRWSAADGWRAGVNWFEPGKKLNNVDCGHGFPAGAERWDIVCAANRTDRALDVLRVHTNVSGDFASLELVGRVPIGAGFAAGTDAPYGLALCGPQAGDRWSVFTSDKQGRVAQYELRFNAGSRGAGQVIGQRFGPADRPWQISEKGCEIEGLVADVTRGVVYIGSEDEGIFRYRLRDGVMDTASKVVVDRVGRRLKADVEGLTLYSCADGTGHLIASSQGSDQFAVYAREFEGDAPNRHLTNFTIGASGRFDAVRSTDGIDAVCADFGGPLAEGVFIAHDGDGASPSNYKIVAWARIAAVLARSR
jgi:3-phytase